MLSSKENVIVIELQKFDTERGLEGILGNILNSIQHDIGFANPDKNLLLKMHFTKKLTKHFIDKKNLCILLYN